MSQSGAVVIFIGLLALLLYTEFTSLSVVTTGSYSPSTTSNSVALYIFIAGIITIFLWVDRRRKKS